MAMASEAGSRAHEAARSAVRSGSRPFILLLLLFITSLVLQPPVDPDFGWHLRMGLDLVRHPGRIPETDPYSHTMPDWPWVDHAWLTDAVMGTLATILGGWGLGAIVAVFGALTLWAFVWSASVANAGAVARLLAVSAALWTALPFLGVRTQMVTLLGLAIVSWVWTRLHHGHHEVSWTLPLIFLVWSNLHGGFTAGFFYLGLVLTLALMVGIVTQGAVPGLASLLRRSDEPVPARPVLGRVAGIVVISALATLLNPYGWHLHREIYQSLTDRFMLEVLHEWQPISVDTLAGRWFYGYVGLLAFLLAGWYRRIEPIRVVTLAIFLWLAVRHFRNIPFFLLLSAPLLAELLQRAGEQLWTLVQPWRWMQRWATLSALALLSGVLVYLGPDHLEAVTRSVKTPVEFFQHTGYPIEAVLWVQRHRDRVGTRLFNEYGDGGFLLWWLPDQKIFIDGRMPAWRIDDRWIFYDYMALTTSDPPAVWVLDKYGVDWGMVKRDSSLDRTLRGRTDWDTVYDDSKVVIYVKRAT